MLGVASNKVTRCQAKSSQFNAKESDADVTNMIGLVGENVGGENEINLEKQEILFFSSRSLMKPMHTTEKWRHPRTRDGRSTVFCLLTGAIDTDEGIKTELLSFEKLQLSNSFFPAFLDAERIMNALLSFFDNLCDSQDLLLDQGISELTDPLHSKVEEDFLSSCTIALPFPLKPDYDEDVIKFSGNDSTTIYAIRYHGFGQCDSLYVKKYSNPIHVTDVISGS